MKLRTIILLYTLLGLWSTINAQRQTLPGQDTVYMKVDKMPEFPDGVKAMWAFMATCPYPDSARAHNIKGTTIVIFVVEKDGSFSEMKVVRSVDPLLDKATLDCIMSMPKWNPGLKGDAPVRCQVTLPYYWGPDKQK